MLRELLQRVGPQVPGGRTLAFDQLDRVGGHEGGLHDQRRAVRERAEHHVDAARREEERVVEPDHVVCDEPLVLADPPLPYDEASDLLDRPIGSLGPSRRRCLDKMRTLLDDTPGGTP